MSISTPLRPAHRGRVLWQDPRYDRGTAFTAEERAALGLRGLLPPGGTTLEQQGPRAYEQYRAQPDDLLRNTFLAALHDRKEVLYYKLLADHLTEMLPVVHDPVVAQAIDRFSHVLGPRRRRGRQAGRRRRGRGGAGQIETLQIYLECLRQKAALR